MTTSGPSRIPSRIGARMLARQDGLGPFRRGLPLSAVIVAGLLIVASVSAVVVLRDREGERALQGYAAGARDVTVEALATDPIPYLGQRVHMRGWSAAVSHGDGVVLLTLSGTADDEDGTIGPRILVIAPDDVSIAGHQEAEVWGVVEAVPRGGEPNGSAAEMVTVRAPYVEPIPR